MAGRPRPPALREQRRPRRLSPILSERNFLIGLFILFIVMTIWIVSVPYDPMKGDIADASTNAIWSEYYKEGKFAVTYDQWKTDNRTITQSSVIMLDGKPYVVNEKGPAHAIFTMVLGKATGTVFAAVATVATYMLGRRIFNWKVGAIGSLFVLTNLSIMAMWYKDYWVDASTVHLMVLSMWLFVEAGLKMKAYFEKKQKKALYLSLLLGIGAGVSFGSSVATRYTVAIVIVPAIVYIFVTFGKPLAYWIKLKNIKGLGGTLGHMVVYLLPFILGLFLVLIPLMSYNNTYFGGPFRSGYDATSLMDYTRTSGNMTQRNQTDFLSTDPMGKVENIAHNSIALAPVILVRMMCLLFVPIAMWKLWKRPIFWLLFLWGLVIMIGFYSMDWVDKYAKIPPIPWEPRYQMPALPAFALLGAHGLYTFAKAIGRKVHGLQGGFSGPIFALAVTTLIVFMNVAPMDEYLQDVRSGKNVGVPNNGGPPGGQPLPPQLTIKDVYTKGQGFVGKLIRINGCHIVSLHLGPNGQVHDFNMTDPSTTQELTVVFLDYPTGTVPPVKVGSKVSVNGMFQWHDANSNGKIDAGEPVMTVKFNTQDKVIIEK